MNSIFDRKIQFFSPINQLCKVAPSCNPNRVKDLSVNHFEFDLRLFLNPCKEPMLIIVDRWNARHEFKFENSSNIYVVDPLNKTIFEFSRVFFVKELCILGLMSRDSKLGKDMYVLPMLYLKIP